MNTLWRIILMTFLLLLFAVAVWGTEPQCPERYRFILEYPLVSKNDLTCDSHRYKEHPCELRVSFNEKKNVVFLVVYSKDKSRVMWISVSELILGEGQILYDKDREL